MSQVHTEFYFHEIIIRPVESVYQNYTVWQAMFWQEWVCQKTFLNSSVYYWLWVPTWSQIKKTGLHLTAHSSALMLFLLVWHISLDLRVKVTVWQITFLCVKTTSNCWHLFHTAVICILSIIAVNWGSFITVIITIPYNLAPRICLIIKNLDTRKRPLHDLKQTLLEKQYPAEIINIGIKKALTQTPQELRRVREQTNENNLLCLVTTYHPDNP